MSYKRKNRKGKGREEKKKKKRKKENSKRKKGEKAMESRFMVQRDSLFVDIQPPDSAPKKSTHKVLSRQQTKYSTVQYSTGIPLAKLTPTPVRTST